MNRATIGFYLAVVLGSCSMNGVSQADEFGFAPIFPDTCYHLTHYWPAA
ncbi:pilus-assembly fibrillin subunit, partial [Escherichia coli]